MRTTGASLAVKALEDEGVPFTFGIPGTHNIELYDALAESDSVRAILVTDEQSASFMADGLWRASGHLGCVNLVPGAGLTHALSGIAEAFMDQIPLLVLGCGIRRDSGRAFQLHDVDQQALVRPVVKASYLVRRTSDLYGTIREACRVAREGVAGPVFVEVPANLYMVSEEVGGQPAADTSLADLPATDLSAADLPGTNGPRTEAVRPADGRRVGGDGGSTPGAEGAGTLDLAPVLEILEGAQRLLLYVGAGAAGATAEVLALAEHLEAPVCTTFQGKGVFPESHPLFLWPGFGDAAPRFARRIASGCDAVLAIGCRFGEVGTGSYGLTMPGPLVHVDLDAEVLNRNYPAQVAIQADAVRFLPEVLAALGDQRRGADEELRGAIKAGHVEVWREWLQGLGGKGVTPAHLLRSLQDTLGEEAVYATDSGNGTFLAAECLRLDRPGRFLAPVDFSCMGYSVPAAVGAKLGRPDVPVVALAGDGAFLMTGLELLTAAREGVGVMVLVLRDRELAQIAQFQDTALNRKSASRVADYDLRSLSAGMDIEYLAMSTDQEVGEVLEEALACTVQGRPIVVDVAIDYSKKTYFTRGVVKTNLLRLPLRDQARFVGRAVKRRLTGWVNPDSE